MTTRTSLLSLFIAVTLLISACSNTPEQYPDSAHNARNALDWMGVYRGVLPCADCEGIETVVVLRSDGHYTSQSKYLGRSDDIFSAQGRIEWNKAGHTITLPEQDVRYFVAENRLLHLNQNGAGIHGTLANQYALNKLADGVTGRYWTLVELNGKALEPSPQTPYFSLDSETGRITGYAGCNRFFGGYELDAAASRLRFTQLASTMMACPDRRETEAAFMDMLRSIDNFSISDETLSLNRARMAPLARFEAVYIR
ncbi:MULTISPECIES: META domain-containing protein [Spongiibacter]|uniref:META domain-containing protein n=1 Tax=Spongiibacter TaxID=630749 RepID=UPI000C5F377A|nr:MULTISPECIES: META domain-containing protein [Spongiibacter]MAY40564.1 hypothetical protein [Spongiibacter sp.]MBO6753928.1 META domain-containing protein [Spongiibacter sp.]